MRTNGQAACRDLRSGSCGSAELLRAAVCGPCDLAGLSVDAGAHGSRLGSSKKRVFPEPFLSRSYRPKRQTSKYSNACEPWLKPQATVWRGLARPIWPNRREPSQAGPSRAVTSLVTPHCNVCLDS